MSWAAGIEVFSNGGHPGPPPEEGVLLKDYQQRLGKAVFQSGMEEEEAHQASLLAGPPPVTSSVLPWLPDETPQNQSSSASAGLGVTVSCRGIG